QSHVATRDVPVATRIDDHVALIVPDAGEVFAPGVLGDLQDVPAVQAKIVGKERVLVLATTHLERVILREDETFLQSRRVDEGAVSFVSDPVSGDHATGPQIYPRVRGQAAR